VHHNRFTGHNRRAALGRIGAAAATLWFPSTALFGRAASPTPEAIVESKTVFWEGRGKSRALFNIAGDVFWQGRGSTQPLANVRGRVSWRGRSVLSAILSVDQRDVAWMGTGRSKALFSKDANGVFWEGTGRSVPLANLDGRTIWQGRGRQRALANWEGDRFSDTALFTAIWLLLDPSRLEG
jgi:hypothetical protein